MKKLTLDETWKLCLSMWRWIAKQVRKNSALDPDDLKIEWLEKHGYVDESIDDECFFCERNNRLGGRSISYCCYCPGRKIDKEFYCMNCNYHYSENPIGFYNKLVSLNRKRLAKRKK